MSSRKDQENQLIDVFMTLTFVTNYVHHHQLPIADEFFRIIGKDYCYIATEPLPNWLIKGGYDPTLEREYIVRSYLSDKELKRARLIIDESDVVIAGDSPLEWFAKRKREGKVTFHCSERIYKKGTPWLRLPFHAIKNYLNYGRFNQTYMLCASAFTSYDFGLTHCFKNRCFKWGYFTVVDVDEEWSRDDLMSKDETRIMWCARFLLWKHPELPVMLAARLKKKGYNFVIDMFGSGEQFENTKALIKKHNVEDCVNLCGNRPNAEILNEMRQHAIFLFTSDKNEGWGAVLNESMSCGCVPVASEAIGSVPYLIKNGKNGLIFQSCNIDSLEKAVCFLLDNPEGIMRMSKEALNTMQNVWSPRNAASNFLELAKCILDGKLNNYKHVKGPASWD